MTSKRVNQLMKGYQALEAKKVALDNQREVLEVKTLESLEDIFSDVQALNIIDRAVEVCEKVFKAAGIEFEKNNNDKAVKTVSNKEDKAKIKELEKALKEANKKIDSVEKENKNIKEAAVLKDTEIERLSGFEDKCKTLESGFETLNEKNSKTVADNAELMCRIEELEKALKEAKEAKEKLEAEVAKFNANKTIEKAVKKAVKNNKQGASVKSKVEKNNTSADKKASTKSASKTSKANNSFTEIKSLDDVKITDVFASDSNRSVSFKINGRRGQASALTDGVAIYDLLPTDNIELIREAAVKALMNMKLLPVDRPSFDDYALHTHDAYCHTFVNDKGETVYQGFIMYKSNKAKTATPYIFKYIPTEGKEPRVSAASVASWFNKSGNVTFTGYSNSVFVNAVMAIINARAERAKGLEAEDSKALIKELAAKRRKAKEAAKAKQGVEEKQSSAPENKMVEDSKSVPSSNTADGKVSSEPVSNATKTDKVAEKSRANRARMKDMLKGQLDFEF